jgi:hypothetical protein
MSFFLEKKKEDIFNKIKHLNSLIKPNETALIYISSHAERTEDGDTIFEMDDDDSVSVRWIRSLINSPTAFILDCCQDNQTIEADTCDPLNTTIFYGCDRNEVCNFVAGKSLFTRKFISFLPKTEDLSSTMKFVQERFEEERQWNPLKFQQHPVISQPKEMYSESHECRLVTIFVRSLLTRFTKSFDSSFENCDSFEIPVRNYYWCLPLVNA